jgi:hypothetical protein
MQRIAAVWHASPQKMVGMLFALLLATAMAVGSGANFSTQSANPGNMVTAGKLTISNSKNGVALFNVGPLKPGDVDATSMVTIGNTGDVPGAFSLSMKNVNDVQGLAGAASGKLSDTLKLTIQETNAAGTANIGSPVFDDLVKNYGVAAKSLSTWAAGSSHTYRFTVTWPNGTTAVDNALMGTKVTMDFDWDAVTT